VNRLAVVVVLVKKGEAVLHDAVTSGVTDGSVVCKVVREVVDGDVLSFDRLFVGVVLVKNEAVLDDAVTSGVTDGRVVCKFREA